MRSPQLVEAIAGVPGGIQALVLEWSDPDKIAITVGWTRIANRNAAAAFAAPVRATKRSSNGLTAIGPAMLAAAAAFDHMPEPAGHRVIDISGDGMANFGVPPAVVRDALVKHGHHDQRAGDPDRGTLARRVLPPERDRRARRRLCVRQEFRQLRRGDAAQAGAGGREPA